MFIQFEASKDNNYSTSLSTANTVWIGRAVENLGLLFSAGIY